MLPSRSCSAWRSGERRRGAMCFCCKILCIAIRGSASAAMVAPDGLLPHRPVQFRECILAHECKRPLDTPIAWRQGDVINAGGDRAQLRKQAGCPSHDGALALQCVNGRAWQPVFPHPTTFLMGGNKEQCARQQLRANAVDPSCAREERGRHSGTAVGSRRRHRTCQFVRTTHV